MAIPKSIFLIYCLVLTCGLIWSYSLFANYFNQRPEVAYELEQVKEQLAQEKFEQTIMAYRLKDFEQTVSGLLPAEKFLTNEKIVASRNLLSAIRAPASLPPMDLSSVVYESVKNKFKERKFDDVVEKAKKLIDTYPSSVHVVESYFFMAESYFHKSDLKKCTETIDLMVAQFPDHDLTGFILLRLGQISEMNSQPDEAREIYSLVSQQFNNPTLKNQALVLLKEVR